MVDAVEAQWRHWADTPPFDYFDKLIEVYRIGSRPSLMRPMDAHPEMNINGLYWRPASLFPSESVPKRG